MILSRFPNYEEAAKVEEVSASDLEPSVFRERYVQHNRPVVVRGAARHWPICGADLPALKQVLGEVPDIFVNSKGLLTEPLLEYAGERVGGAREEAQRRRPKMGGAEFLDRLATEQEQDLVAYAIGLDTPGLHTLKSQMGSLPFYGGPLREKAFMYSSRLFLYRGGYTDWHFHYSDEAITVQIAGDKEFMLLPPGKAEFDALWSVARHRGVWEMSAADRERLHGLRPLRVVLHPGDVIYIPVFWWHAVEPVDKVPGLTAAFVFSSPKEIQFDLRFPAARWNLQQAVERPAFRKLIPALLGAGLWAFVRNPIAPMHIPRA